MLEYYGALSGISRIWLYVTIIVQKKSVCIYCKGGRRKSLYILKYSGIRISELV